VVKVWNVSHRKTVTRHCGRSDRTRLPCPVSSNRRQTHTREGHGPVRLVPRGTITSGRTPISIVNDEELIGHAARLVTCDGTRPIAMGALWTPIGRRVQHVRSFGEVHPVTAMFLSTTHCCCLSCSDRTRPVTLTGASGHHVFHCVVR
jgi:hypothetical protein